MDITEYCERELSSYGHQLDIKQRIAVNRLQRFQNEWIIYKSKCSNALKKFITHIDIPRGVYIWGGVGRGKSFLTDSFYIVLPIHRKIRLHFHEFMNEIHYKLNRLKGNVDPLNILAQRITKHYRLIFFDEFYISDIADAMILYRLLDQLFMNGVQFIITSNYDPESLYQGGLNRDRILPTIALLREKLDILNVDAGIDYRRSNTEGFCSYYTPLGVNTEHELRKEFDNIATTIVEENPLLCIEERKFRALRKSNGIVWFDFSTLCGSARSQSDYLELVNRFHTIILCDVPKMSEYMKSEVRRFIWLIDILYDHKIKLLMSAEVPLKNLYIHDSISHEFNRTMSRIIEMQSYKYLKIPRRIVNRLMI